MAANYKGIVAHYESCLEQHGDSHLGVDWPNLQDAHTRYRVMLDLIRPASIETARRILDFGCGTAHLLEYIRARQIRNIVTQALICHQSLWSRPRQVSPVFLSRSSETADLIPSFDYIVMNGVLPRSATCTVKC